jgi:hypothetical protein
MPPDAAITAADLSALRADALARLAEGDRIDAGLLRLVADVSAVLAALNAAKRMQ